jgi:ankyrin repeat protein
MTRTLQTVLAQIESSTAFSDLPMSITTRSIFGDYPIHAVAGWADKEGVEILLKHGADINSIGDRGETPIYSALKPGNEEFLRVMIDHGARTDVKNDNGDTPADIARALGHEDIAKFLEHYKK